MSMFVGILLIALGIAGMLFVGRRKFYQRNEAGVYVFNSYRSALGNAALNWLISIVSAGVFIVGVVKLVASAAS